MSVLPVVTKRMELTLPSIWWRTHPHWSFWRVMVWLAALLVGGLMLLAPLYLLVRTAEVGDSAVSVLFKTSTLETLGRTIWLSTTVTIATILLAVPLAWLTTCTDLPGRRFWAVAAALPLVLPSYVMAYLLVAILGPKGLLQQVFYPLIGIEKFPDIYGFPGALLAMTLMSYPYTLLTVRAALRRMDPSLVEAARSLGLSPWRAFWRITLPQLRPSIMAGSLLVALYVLRDFGGVTMMRYTTFTRLIYQQYQSFSDRALAAVLSLVLVAMTAVLLYFEFQTRGKAQYARRSAGAMRPACQVQLGRWKWPALLFVGTVVLVALGLPMTGLVYWLVRGWMQGTTFQVLWGAATNSLLASAGTAVLAVCAALPVAILSVKRPNRLSHLLERLTYAGYALPGLVIALSFVFFGLRYTPSFYQTLPMLLLGYTVLFVPQAVGAARTSLLQVPPTLEEAGRSLGHTPWQVFGRITAPLLHSGLLAGLGLVFLTCMKELPTTLILSPIGFETLATAVWSHISEAFFAQAAAPALLLILLSSIPLAFLTLRDQ